MSERGWYGVDLDGTLAYYEEWVAVDYIGQPIARMVKRVKQWLDDGKNVKIMTARVAPPIDRQELLKCRAAIEAWCIRHIGQILPITHEKDRAMIELWDDRVVAVEQNTGRAFNWKGGPSSGTDVYRGWELESLPTTS